MLMVFNSDLLGWKRKELNIHMYTGAHTHTHMHNLSHTLTKSQSAVNAATTCTAETTVVKLKCPDLYTEIAVIT